MKAIDYYWKTFGDSKPEEKECCNCGEIKETKNITVKGIMVSCCNKCETELNQIK